MTDLLTNFHMALPELVILITALVTLLCDLFFSRKVAELPFYMASLGLFISGLSSFLLLGQFSKTLFSGLFIADDIAELMKIFIVLSVFLSFFYSRQYLKDRHMPSGDYYVLGLFSTLGMMILVSSHSLLTIFLGLELMSLPLYAMVAIRRSNSDASEASMKYFVMGAIATGMMLYGISLLYGATGALDLQEVASAISATAHGELGLLSFALVFIIAGVGFKLAAMPFHMWAPDVYTGAPTSVTLFIAAAPKIAAIGMAIRLLSFGLMDVSLQWQQLILVMALLSVGLGNLIAIAQNNLKRLFAYSAISHMGYALFGILAGTKEGFTAAIYYAIIYVIMTAAAFGLMVLMSRQDIEIEHVDDLKGLNKRNPWLALMMLIVLFSMAGVPPTVGFFAKFLVLKALVDVNMTWVAVLGLAFAVMGTFYYLRIIKVMYFDESTSSSPVKLTLAANLVFSVNCLSLLYLGIFPSALIEACTRAFSG